MKPNTQKGPRASTWGVFLTVERVDELAKQDDHLLLAEWDTAGHAVQDFARKSSAIRNQQELVRALNLADDALLYGGDRDEAVKAIRAAIALVAEAI